MKNKPFYFIGDLIESDTINELEIMPNFLLRKANDSQIAIIKKVLTTLDTNLFMSRFEMKVTERIENGFSAKTVGREEWNYWVIEHQTNLKDNLELAVLLSDPKLHIIFNQIVNEEGDYFGHSSSSVKSFNYKHKLLYSMKSILLSDINPTKITYINNCLNLFERHQEKYPYIKKALDDFRQLDSIAESSSFYYLSLFSIIECILTNNNSNSSISKQLKTKIFLLNNRFQQPMEMDNYFINAKFEKVIAQLYSLRSDIAHGDISDFQKELNVISTKENAQKFLYELTQKLIIQAMIEPQLISDLKNC